jgi:cytochrome c-type biogenesis protein CcmF
VVGPYAAWKQADAPRVWRELRLVLAVSVLGALGVSVALQASVDVALGSLLALWILLGTVHHVGQRLAGGAGLAGFLQRARSVPLSFWGMVVAHAGIAVFVLGATLVRGLDHAQDASLQLGDTVQVGGHRFTFTELTRRNGPNFIAARATFEVQRDGQKVATLHPEKRIYTVQRMPMTEAAIDRRFSRDLYVSLGEAAPDGRWGVRVQVKPFMAGVWSGCLLMAFGGVLAASDRRYRQRKAQAFRVPASGADTAAWHADDVALAARTRI